MDSELQQTLDSLKHKLTTYKRAFINKIRKDYQDFLSSNKEELSKMTLYSFSKSLNKGFLGKKILIKNASKKRDTKNIRSSIAISIGDRQIIYNGNTFTSNLGDEINDPELLNVVNVIRQKFDKKTE
ncbi:hypothetical protein CWI38_0170p0020 [Hamiltosporidium tvaerminnensis]|uniref:Uncharacterized protein n=2 Tax=Hamiltosporidium TaxID=1176354 RepID=A0A4Q9LGR7_9MICR|nr:hypothetical protein LUQ84_001913 [Hamiltosporidium tvaerminnensis]TBU06625.1 hypothetical protein CWI39_0453p0010 [Hamiltosporidium magnivora]TBU19928.1 hypothetical protein CWI38_0170p0020 [Hamiltosporidium tvaerminnensis]